MTSAIVLDILLGLIIVLSMPLGFWRGVTKEVFVSAGILLGASVAAAWDERWGRHVADLLAFGDSSGRFVAAMGLMLFSTLVVGYGGGILAAPAPGVGLSGRLAGALVAPANAIVLLGWALDVIARDLADARARDVIEDSIVSGRLLRDDEWILLGISGTAVAAVLIGSVVVTSTRREALPQIDEAAPGDRGPVPPDRLRPVRFPRNADTGKFEPRARQFDPATGRYGSDAPSLSTAMPLTGVDRTRWSVDTSGTTRVPPWRRRQDSGSAARDVRAGNREWLRRSETPARERRDDGRGDRGLDRPDRQTDRPKRCAACGAQVSAADAFCPRCGTGMSR